MAKGRRSSKGGNGGISGMLITLIVVLFLIYVALNFVSVFAPEIGNLTYTGGGIGATIFAMVQTWLMPLALIGLLIYAVYAFLGHRR